MFTKLNIYSKYVLIFKGLEGLFDIPNESEAVFRTLRSV